MAKLTKPNSPITVSKPRSLSKPETPTEVSPRTVAPAVQKAEPKPKVTDKAIGKSYSLRQSQHQWLIDEAIRLSARSGKRVTASNLLSEILANHIESSK